MAAEFFDDGGDLAGGDALDVHLGQGQLEGLFAADALFEGLGIEVQIAAHLGHAELDGANAGGDGLGFEAIGLALPGFGAFVGLGLERLGAFLAHGFIDQEAEAFGEAVGALLGEKLQNGVHEFRIAWVGHFGFELVVFADTPTGNHYGPPPASFSRGERRHPHWGSAALDALRSSSLRLTPKGWRRREERQFTERVLHRLEVIYAFSESSKERRKRPSSNAQ